MSTGSEWEPVESSAEGAAAGGSADPPVDEFLQFGRQPGRIALVGQRLADRLPRVPATARIVAVAVLVVGVVTGYVVVPRLNPPAQTIAAPAPARTLPGDQEMATVVAIAGQGTPLYDVVRPNSTAGACALVPLGTPLRRHVLGALRYWLPDYRVRDTSRIIDQFTALCTFSVRATDSHGSVLVLQVVAPPRTGPRRPFTVITVASRSDGTRAVSLAAAQTEAGWQVTVGAVGPQGDQPSSAALVNLAQDAHLLW
jgi:hypothetical protein